MPQFTPKQVSDPSNLTHGRHPGYLLAITEEVTPADWKMAEKSPTMYRWHLAIWEHDSHMAQYAPEEQSGLTSTAFSPKGKFQASKAYVWTCSLLGREIPKGQGADLDPLLPLACLVDIERIPGNDYAKVAAIWGRTPDTAIPAVIHQLRAQYATGFPPANGRAPQSPTAPAPQPLPLPPPVQQWGQPGPHTPPSTQPAGWPQAQPQQAPQPVLPGTAPKGTGSSVPF